ncbi:MAG: hypothetical protein IKZ28_05410, partial [Clostridia bacterium]|nr:hypothetical protein [Clostridia bacterium]
VESLIMMDTHNQDVYVDENVEERREWAKVTNEQIRWYQEQCKALKARGCTSSTLILHIPIYAYREASAAAYKTGMELNALTVAQSEKAECWNEGYTESIGVQHEGISSPLCDEGLFSTIKGEGLTKRVLAGHDHVNNWIIAYEGVKFIYALKTGSGCYWDSALNGGTVLKVNKNGVYEVYHEYVKVIVE